jgi:hypothetical protein
MESEAAAPLFFAFYNVIAKDCTAYLTLADRTKMALAIPA